MRDPHMSKLIAKSCAKWHQAELPGKRESILWNRFDTWLALAQQGGDEVLPEGYSWYTIKQEIQLLRDYLEGLHSPCVAAHNDLTAGNLIYDPETGTSDR